MHVTTCVFSRLSNVNANSGSALCFMGNFNSRYCTTSFVRCSHLLQRCSSLQRAQEALLLERGDGSRSHHSNPAKQGFSRYIPQVNCQTASVYHGATETALAVDTDCLTRFQARRNGSEELVN
mmetsp:Transcript_1006/g.2063  ORF Transcript_1006/g.2063 Transcript_1006/m.2063 type:complete len:123 (-) Transcript_1006:813-1181(-)